MPDRRHAGASGAQEQPPGVPGWVWLIALGTVIIMGVLIAVMLLIGGEHGPGRHGG